MKRPEPKVLAEFVDSFGDTRQVIRRKHGRALAVRPLRTGVCAALNKALGPIVGGQIRAHRVRQNMTMLELSQRAGLSGGKQRVKHIEVALDGPPKLGTLYAIAHALGVGLEALLPPVCDALEESSVAEVGKFVSGLEVR